MAERVRVPEITNDEGDRLLRTVRRSSGSVVTWRRAQIVLMSAQGMDVPAIAQVAFTSADRVRDVIHNFNTAGFDSLRPGHAGGRPPKFGPAQRAKGQDVGPVSASRSRVAPVGPMAEGRLFYENLAVRLVRPARAPSAARDREPVRLVVVAWWRTTGV